MQNIVQPVAAALILGLLASGPAHSQDQHSVKETRAETAPTASGGLRAYLDPATGRLIDHPPYGKPTLELSRKELYMFNDSGFGLIERVLPDGTLSIDLKGRFREGSVATLGDNGDVRVHRIGGEMFIGPTGETISQQMFRKRHRAGGGGQ